MLIYTLFMHRSMDHSMNSLCRIQFVLSRGSLREQNVHQIVRVTPFIGAGKCRVYGHAHYNVWLCVSFPNQVLSAMQALNNGLKSVCCRRKAQLFVQTVSHNQSFADHRAPHLTKSVKQTIYANRRWRQALGKEQKQHLCGTSARKLSQYSKCDHSQCDDYYFFQRMYVKSADVEVKSCAQSVLYCSTVNVVARCTTRLPLVYCAFVYWCMRKIQLMKRSH